MLAHASCTNLVSDDSRWRFSTFRANILSIALSARISREGSNGCEGVDKFIFRHVLKGVVLDMEFFGYNCRNRLDKVGRIGNTHFLDGRNAPFLELGT